MVNSNKLLFSFVFCIIIYYGVQVFNLIGLGVLWLFDKDLFNQLNSNVPSVETIASVFNFTIIISIIGIVICYFISYLAIKKD